MNEINCRECRAPDGEPIILDLKFLSSPEFGADLGRPPMERAVIEPFSAVPDFGRLRAPSDWPCGAAQLSQRQNLASFPSLASPLASVPEWGKRIKITFDLRAAETLECGRVVFDAKRA